MANLTCRIMRRLMEFAIDQGIRTDNPFHRIKSYKIGTHHTWTEDELSAFEKRWPIGTRERLAYAVLLYAGQRGGDAVEILRSGIIDLVQQKTGAPMKIAIPPSSTQLSGPPPRKAFISSVMPPDESSPPRASRGSLDAP
jgi:hypothetical protein